MEGFVKNAEAGFERVSPGVSSTVVHAVAWLTLGNAIGLMLALLLVLPGLNPFLGEWTYGRWMMVHMNVLLFGWCSLPLIGFLFHVYGADRGVFAQWCRPTVWLWSAALMVGSYSWLSGESSGKLFLDWSGYSRVFFPVAMFGLWIVLALTFFRGARSTAEAGWATVTAKVLGLLIMLAVPFAIYTASGPGGFPYINPDTGGPTGQSQLESSLGIVLLLLLLPLGVTSRKAQRRRAILPMAWTVLFVQAVICAALGRADASHRALGQWLGVSSLIVWAPLVPAYYRLFAWRVETRRWRMAFLAWWIGLVISGCIFFLPGVLDRFKFTDGLVGHSLTAVAGCLTAYLVFILIELTGNYGAGLFNRTWSFYAWNLGVLAYVFLMTVTGWIEGAQPEFTFVPGVARNVAYSIRVVTGAAMLAASLDWLLSAVRMTDPGVTTASSAVDVEAA